MEMSELDNTIKRALLSKANEIIPSEETFTKILAGLEKKQAHRALKINYKNYLIALICTAFIIIGAIFTLSFDIRVSAATKIMNTFKTMFVLDKSNEVKEKNEDEVFNRATANKTENVDAAKGAGVKVFLWQPFLNQVHDLELYLRLLIAGKMVIGETWDENRFWYRKLLTY